MTPSLLLVADGASIHTQRLAAAVARSGWRVDLAAFEGPTLEGVEHHALGDAPPTRDSRYPVAVPRLASLIRSLRPSVVHAHYVSSYGAMARAAMALLTGSRRPPLVVTAWGSDLLVTPAGSRLRAAIARWTLRGADLVTGDSADLRAAAQALAPRARWHDFIFGPEAVLIEASRPAVGSGVVSARAFVPEMRVELIVSAYHLARRTSPGVMSNQRLTVAGHGEGRPAIAAAAGAGVDVVGPLSRAELHATMLRSRVIVSIPRSDGTSAALLDGLAAGLTPVVNDITANRQWVDEEIGEIVSRDPSVEELAAALVRAVSRSVAPDVIRARVRPVAWEDQVASLLDAFRRLLR